MMFSLSPDDGRSFLLAIGLGAIVGVIFGGWIMTLFHKLLMALVKMVLLGAVVALGIVLWNEYQASQPPQYSPGAYAYSGMPGGSPVAGPIYQEPPMVQSSARWWEH